jgi:replication factor C subunit 3/5
MEAYNSDIEFSDDEIDNTQEITNNETLPWIEKYRPKTLDEIISHNDIINTLRTFIKKRCLPHLLLYGPPGTGKTSIITACAKELYGKYYNFMVMELNASDDRGIEVVRHKIKEFVISKNVFFGEKEDDRDNIFKLVILDETDAMTDDAQAILRKVVEKYTENTRFCLICNYIQKINPALQSRCTGFRLAPLKPVHIKNKIIKIAKIENIKLTNSGIETVIKRSHGDMRKVLNILQSTNMAYNIVNSKNINNCLGYPQKNHVNIIIDSLINKNFQVGYHTIYELKEQEGLALTDIVHEIHDIIVNHIMGKENNKNIKKLSNVHVCKILDRLRIIDYNLSVNTIDNIQLGALVSVFKLI